MMWLYICLDSSMLHSEPQRANSADDRVMQSGVYRSADKVVPMLCMSLIKSHLKPQVVYIASFV